LFRCGGRWDRKSKRWTGNEPRSVIRCVIHEGQREAAKFFEQWLTAYMDNDADGMAVYSALLLGGTRSGKTWLGLRFMIAFAIAVPKARV